MHFPSMVAIVIVFIIWLSYELKKSSSTDYSFWERENEANSVRKKPLDNLHYITIPLDSLPFFSGIDEKINDVQKEIHRMADLTIVDLSEYTNTDLKLMYGAANLPALSKYDQHFIQLVRLLFQWGKRLHELSYNTEAIQVLEFGIQCGTDVRAHYLLLAKLYIEMNQSHKIADLIERAHGLHSFLKDTIIQELSSMLSE